MIILLVSQACSEQSATIKPPEKNTLSNEEIDTFPDVTDHSFGDDGFVQSSFDGTPILIDSRDMSISDTGKIAVTGHYETINSGGKHVAVMMTDSVGNKIGTFGQGGQAYLDFGVNTFGVSVEFQGEKLIVVSKQGPYIHVSRLDEQGSLDSSFRDVGHFREDRVDRYNYIHATELKIDDNGSIYIGGYISPGSGLILKYLPDGEPDTTFGENGIVRLDHEKPLKGGYLSFLSDGRLLLGSLLSHNSSEFKAAITCFNSDGSVDSTFGDNGTTIVGYSEGDFGLYIRGMETDTLGRTVVVSSNNYEGLIASRSVLFRLDSDGLVETEFGEDGLLVIGAGNSLGLFEPAFDGDKILLGGYVRENVFDTKMTLIRLLDSGELDTTFGYGGLGIFELGELNEGRDIGIYGGNYYVSGYTSSKTMIVGSARP